MHLGNRYAQHSFAQVPNVNIARSSFLLNHTAKDTMDFDLLTPFYVREILPGDTFNVNVNVFARLATQKVPIMDNMYMDWHFFFVPNRLVWENWERFNGAQDDPGDSTDFLIPQVVAPAVSGFPVGSTADHMGLPTGVPGLSVSALPFRSYQLIYNEWYRNQNVASSYVVPKGDGPDLYSLYTLLAPSAPAHDYFNTALPWPQKGPAVELPLGTSAPVISNSLTPNITTPTSSLTNQGLQVINSGGVDNSTLKATAAPAASAAFIWGDESGLEADLSAATAATINALRQAFMVQSLLELDARGGTRYVEILQAHFNVISPDFRLQRPEFLGGGRSSINAHPVAQTSPTAGSDYAASLSSFATMSSTGGNIGYSKSFVEHGYVLGICRARADITYQQGIRRDWSRQTRYDYFWPKLQLMGEQAILNKELYAQGTSDDDEVFGYAERYAEYRTIPSEIRGQFRSTFAQSLDVWHLAQEYASLPVINSPFFFNSQTPIERCIANSSAVHLLVDMFFEEKAARPIVSNPTPATLGRF